MANKELREMRALFLLKPLSISDESPMACHGDESRFFLCFYRQIYRKGI